MEQATGEEERLGMLLLQLADGEVRILRIVHLAFGQVCWAPVLLCQLPILALGPAIERRVRWSGIPLVIDLVIPLVLARVCRYRDVSHFKNRRQLSLRGSGI